MHQQNKNNEQNVKIQVKVPNVQKVDTENRRQRGQMVVAEKSKVKQVAMNTSEHSGKTTTGQSGWITPLNAYRLTIKQSQQLAAKNSFQALEKPDPTVQKPPSFASSGEGRPLPQSGNG